MPLLLEHIDAISRKKQRDVLFLTFHPKNWSIFDEEIYDYQKDKRRKKVLKWFDKHGIPWQMCGPQASENGFSSYLGEIYIDVPYDENNPQYQRIIKYLENPDGTMRDEHIGFYYMTFEQAMVNAHHDKPGYWEKWAEEF